MLTLLLSSCSNESCFLCKDTLNRQYYQYYNKHGIEDINNFFKISYKQYFIFLYSVTCPYCENIKGCIFNYLDQNLLPRIFLLQKDKIKDIRTYFKILPEEYTKENKIKYINECINKTSTYDIYYFGVPVLFKINNNKLENMYVGETDITNLFKYLI